MHLKKLNYLYSEYKFRKSTLKQQQKQLESWEKLCN